MTKAECPECAAPLHVLRRPYITPAGRSIRFWAVVCSGCGSARELASFDSQRQKVIRQS